MNRRLVAAGYALPFCLITALFFLWGYARSVLDVLNKHFQEVLHVSVAGSTLVQASTYIAYALMALPAGIIISKKGYRFGIIIGLLLFATGAFIFIPGAQTMRFGIFLAALFVLGCGLAVLETAANPYAAELGPRETSASRLNLAQSFNGLGCILGPVTVGGYIFSEQGGSVAVPYTLMGGVVVVMALVFGKVRLPEITPEDPREYPGNSPAVSESIKWLWKNPTFRSGLLALFCYEVAEISINSLFINYATSDGWLTKIEATAMLSFGALGLFMLFRVIGSGVMSRIPARLVLRVCGVLTILGALSVVMFTGAAAHFGLLTCYAAEAIMFPTIFAMTISCAGNHSKIASSFLMMTPLGGAIGSLLMGVVIAHFSISMAFIVPVIAYAIVTIYAFRQKK